MTTHIVRRETSLTNSTLPLDMHPILRRIYTARDIADGSELDYALQGLHPFSTLKGINEAVELLYKAIVAHKNILIVGDFDADGATSCAVAVRGLKLLGATQVNYLVPNRFTFGYGLTPEIVEVAKQYEPQLLITVDNGISSVAGVAAARQAGIDVLVTDHHLPGPEQPDANAIVNPNQHQDTFSSKALCGVGTIFYVLLALRSYMREQQCFAKAKTEQEGTGGATETLIEPNLAQLLDLVALGTVADVVALDRNNRILVAQGLARIRRGLCSPGILALIKVANRKHQSLVSSDFAFAIAPRLNAAGRIEHMSIGVECLLTDDEETALSLAQRLDELNHERRLIEQDMKQQALLDLEKINLQQEGDLPTGLCLYQQQWHQGVIGILASRIKELSHRPVVVFADADSEDNSEQAQIKGSARSIPGFHIRDAFDAIAAQHPLLLRKFGGHAMAAGLTIKRSDFALFKQLFDQQAQLCLDKSKLCNVIHSDGPLEIAQLEMGLIEQIKNAGPWGQAFPEPMFDGVFELVERKIVGEKHLKLLLKSLQSAATVDAIAFNVLDTDWPSQVKQVEVAYRVDINEFRGFRNPQLIIDYVRPLSGNLD